MVYLEEKTLKNILSVVENIPEETCGFILGNLDNNKKYVVRFIPVQNISKENKEQRYAISPKDYLMAEKTALETNLTLLGVYHSHLNWPAIPSETDRLAAFPNLSYIIISLKNLLFADIKSWILTDNLSFEEEPLIIN